MSGPYSPFHRDQPQLLADHHSPRCPSLQPQPKPPPSHPLPLLCRAPPRPIPRCFRPMQSKFHFHYVIFCLLFTVSSPIVLSDWVFSVSPDWDFGDIASAASSAAVSVPGSSTFSTASSTCSGCFSASPSAFWATSGALDGEVSPEPEEGSDAGCGDSVALLVAAWAEVAFCCSFSISVKNLKNYIKWEKTICGIAVAVFAVLLRLSDLVRIGCNGRDARIDGLQKLD